MYVRHQLERVYMTCNYCDSYGVETFGNTCNMSQQNFTTISITKSENTTRLFKLWLVRVYHTLDALAFSKVYHKLDHRIHVHI